MNENKNASNMQSAGLVPDVIPSWKSEAWREIILKFIPEPKSLWKESNPAADSDIALRERQRGLFELILSIQPEYMLTVRFEQPLHFNAIRSRLKRIGALLDRKLLGRNWHKSNNRSEWIAVIENHIHVHIVLRPPKGRNLTHYTAEYGPQPHLGAYWTDVVGRHRIAAQVHVVRVKEMDELYIADYCAKRGWRKDLWNHEFVILGSEFHTSRLPQIA